MEKTTFYQVYCNSRKEYWRSDFLGYTSNKAEAGLYTREELIKGGYTNLMYSTKKNEDYIIAVGVR